MNKKFMSEQGYNLDTEIKGDNKSTMLLMKNGKLSSGSGKCTKNLDVQYFYVKDLIDRGIVQLSHRISELMIADYFTKPIQGKQFQLLRNMILNIDSSAVHRSMLVDNIDTNVLLEESTEETEKERE
jgi:hypothetical protein